MPGDTPENLMTKSERELRKEYTRQRDIAQKRLKRLQQSEYSGSTAAHKFPDGIPKLRELKSKEDIVFAFYEIQAFNESPYSTIKGQKTSRSKTIDTIKRHYPASNINDSNFDVFTKVMNALRVNRLEKLFGSNRAVALFTVLTEKKIKNLNPILSNPASMAWWLENLENLEAVELPKGKHKSVKAYKELIESEIWHGRDKKTFTISDQDLPVRGKGRRTNRRKRNSKRR